MDEELKDKIQLQINILEKILEEIKEIKTILELCQTNNQIEYKSEYFKVEKEVLLNSALYQFDFTEFDKKINKLLEKYNFLSKNITKEVKEYNEQYKNYIIKEVSNFDEIYNAQKNVNFQYTSFSKLLSNLYNYLDTISQKINLNIDELFDYFKFGNRNYIIFGKNGAGKTSLLYKIKEKCLNQNSFIIPANRSLKCGDFNSLYYSDRNMEDLNEICYSTKTIDILTVKMLKSQSIQLDKAHKSNTMFQETLIDKLYKIFLELNLDRKIKFEYDDEQIYLYDDDIEKYPLFQASDGEKDIVYLIMAIMLLPQNAYVFIDEPENHLNGVLMIDLFNKLEEYRKDLKFVYVTHNIDFIESRNNVDLIYLEKTKKVGVWKFKKIDSFKEIDIDIILNIEGSKKDIIFCEGNNNTSIDYKIYSEIYKDYLVMPVSSCEKVCENVKVINTCKDFRRKTVGIIDNDFKEISECEKLKREKIHTLNFSEVENLLIDKDIVKSISEWINGSAVNIEEIYNEVINFVKEIKSVILGEFLNKKYNKLIKSNVLKYTDNLENDIIKMNEENKNSIIQKVNILSNNIDEYINSNNYEEISKIISGKMVLPKVAKKIGFIDKDKYIDFFVNRLKDNTDFRNLVASKLPVINNKN